MCYISHSVVDLMLSRFSFYRIIVFFSQRLAFAAYRSASSGPVDSQTGPEEADL